MPIRVALVEDDPRFRAVIAAAVSAAPDMMFCGVAESCAAARHWLRQAEPPPDVLLVDLGLPDGSGIEVIAAASRRWPRCDAMVTTLFGDEDQVLRSIAAGAKGYLLKDASPARILEEIRALHAGGSPLSPLIARKVLGRLHGAGVRHAASPGAAPSLSERELQTLQYVTKGFTFEEVARSMGVSRHTVQNFVRRVYVKLEVSSKIEAVYVARKHGLLE
jgi:DNA-binding NarL/FixJ family response regulator